MFIRLMQEEGFFMVLMLLSSLFMLTKSLPRFFGEASSTKLVDVQTSIGVLITFKGDGRFFGFASE